MKLHLLCLASLALANPLRVDVDLHLDIIGINDELGEPDAKDYYYNTKPPKGVHVEDDLPIVELPYEKHQASPPLSVRNEKIS